MYGYDLFINFAEAKPLIGSQAQGRDMLNNTFVAYGGILSN